MSSSSDDKAEVNFERLSHARIDGPGVTLAYMADDKAHVSHWYVLSEIDC